jgi:aspartate/methionine/tyrosine aminotransferase
MKRIDDVHYLRWARAQAEPPHPQISLVSSGMRPPDPHVLGGIDTGQLLVFPAGDHPPIVHRLAEEWRVAPERVLVQPGTHLSLFLMTAARLGEVPGPVVVEEPAYEPLWAIPRMLGAEVLRWPRARTHAFELDPAALDRLVRAEPSLLVLTQPHNPSGAVLSPRDLELVQRLVEKTGCAVLSDEVYLEFCSQPTEVTLLGRLPCAAVTRSFTKVFGLGTLRVCASVGPVDWIEGAAALSDLFAVSLPGPSHALAHRAWDRRHDLWQRARATAAVGREEVRAWAARLGSRIDVHLPETGIICYPRVAHDMHLALLAMAREHGVVGDTGHGLEGHPDGSHVWIEDLRRRRGVQITPGEFFGDERAFRIGFGIDASALREGLRRVEVHLHEAEGAAASAEGA